MSRASKLRNGLRKRTMMYATKRLDDARFKMIEKKVERLLNDQKKPDEESHRILLFLEDRTKSSERVVAILQLLVLLVLVSDDLKMADFQTMLEIRGLGSSPEALDIIKSLNRIKNLSK